MDNRLEIPSVQANISLDLNEGMPMVEETRRRKDLDPIRDRIVEKAAFVFAREYGKGDSAVTIHKICEMAGVTRNQLCDLYPTVTELYREILRSLFDRRKTAYPLDGGLTPDAPARERLLAYVRAILYRQLGYQGVGHSLSERLLLAREVAKPSPNFIQIVLESVVPSIQYLFQIVRDLLGPQSSQTTIRYCALSILNQCIHYGRDQSLTQKLHLGLNVVQRQLKALPGFVWAG